MYVVNVLYVVSLLLGFMRDEDAAMWKGFLFASLLFLLSCLQSLLHHQYMYLCFTVGMRLKTAVMGLIYRKVTENCNSHDAPVKHAENLQSLSRPVSRFTCT